MFGSPIWNLEAEVKQSSNGCDRMDSNANLHEQETTLDMPLIPPELWQQILSFFSMPLDTLLAFRLFSRSLNNAVLASSKLQIPENLICQPPLYSLFPNLKTLFLDIDLFKSDFFDPERVLQLKKLVLFDWNDPRGRRNVEKEIHYDEFWASKLTTLTQLEVLSTSETLELELLEKMTSLRKLTVSLDLPPNERVQHLTTLTKLKTLYPFATTTPVAQNFEFHPSLKNLMFNDWFYVFPRLAVLTTRPPCVVFRTSRQMSCYEMYEGDWELLNEEAYEGYGSVYHPTWMSAGTIKDVSHLDHVSPLAKQFEENSHVMLQSTLVPLWSTMGT